MKNQYADFLREQGDLVFNVRGVDWWGYGGFLIPAYLPDQIPEISAEIAAEALRLSGRPFVRWESQFGCLEEPGQWWHVLRRGPWDIDQVTSKKRRYSIRQSRKIFHTRVLGPEEVVELAPSVAKAAARRYQGSADTESGGLLLRRLEAGVRVPGVLEYVGCFRGESLASWAEMHLSGAGGWVTTIRHDPEFLNLSSSYAMVDGLLEIYLNQRKLDYILDGCRNIHHRTQFQTQLEKGFGFERVYSRLNVIYGRAFGLGVRLASPFSPLLLAVARKYSGWLLDNVAAVLRQEAIRQSFCR